MTAKLEQAQRRYSFAKHAFQVVLALGVTGGLVVAILAYNHSASTSNCVNNVLATRQDTTTQDSVAELSIANANLAFVTSVNQVFTTPPGPAQSAAFIQFEQVSAQTAKTITAATAVLNADKQYRVDHPLGRC
jgi:hypothetical protein